MNFHLPALLHYFSACCLVVGMWAFLIFKLIGIKRLPGIPVHINRCLHSGLHPSFCRSENNLGPQQGKKTGNPVILRLRHDKHERYTIFSTEIGQADGEIS